MTENYLQIQKEYLLKTWSRRTDELTECLPAQFDGKCLRFKAFGEHCKIYPDEIILGDKSVIGPEGILISLYAHYVKNEVVQTRPLKAFKQFPGGMGYQGAFITNAEKALIPHVSVIKKHKEEIAERFSGHINSDAPRCDFSFTLYPLPRVALYYIFNLPDDEFPASVTCLFSANAINYMPVAGLADTAEYTAKKIIGLI